MIAALNLPRAVLDTSVLVPRWSRLVLMRLAVDPYRLYQPIWSEWIATETWRVLTTLLIRAGVEDEIISERANAMFDYFLPVMDFSSVSGAQSIAAQSPLRDPNDAYVWATAVVGAARYVVSHNTTDFPSLVQSVETIDGQQYSVQRHIHHSVEFLTAIEFAEDVLGAEAVRVLGAPLPDEGVLRSQRKMIPM